jgi:hypothetical protein
MSFVVKGLNETKVLSEQHVQYLKQKVFIIYAIVVYITTN